MTSTEAPAKSPSFITCNGCPSKWTGAARCHCSGCHHTFSGITAFDSHRDKDGTCKHPTALGLVLHERGYWASAEVNDYWDKKKD